MASFLYTNNRRRKRKTTTGTLEQPDVRAIKRPFIDRYENLSDFLIDYQIDHEAIDVNYEICQYHPEVFMRIDLITSDLTSGDILFMWGQEVQTVSNDFKKTVNRYWKSFVRDAVKAIMAIGLLPMYIGQLDNGEYVPIVPSNGSYRIYVLPEIGGTQRYLLSWLNINNNPSYPSLSWVDTRAIVLGGWGYDPTAEGKLCCPISSILTSVHFITNLRMCATVAEKQNSDPTMVVTQPKEDVEMEPEVGQFIDCNPVVEEECDKYTRWQENVEIRHELVDKKVQSRVREELSQYYNSQTTVEEKSDTTMNPYNYYDLNPGEGVANRQLPRPRGDLVSLDKLIDDRIGRILGVPTELFSPSSSVRANAELSLTIYQKTITKWSSIISTILTDYVYDPICKQDDNAFKQSLISESYTEKDDSDFLSQSCNSLTMTVIVSTTHLLSNEDVEYARNRGIINWKTYLRIWASRLRVPIHVLESDEDPLSSADRLSIISKRSAGTHRKQKLDDTQPLKPIQTK